MPPRVLSLFALALWLSSVFAKGVKGQSRVLTQTNDSTEVKTVSTERELNDALNAGRRERSLRLAVDEIRLSEPLVVDVLRVSISGAANGTVIHCPPTDGANGSVWLASVTITGCHSHSAVQIESKSEPTDGVIDVVFKTVYFVENGKGGDIEAGAATRVESCGKGSCVRPVVEFRRCRFDRNRAAIGGAIYATDSKIRINDSIFEENEASLSGGALFFSNTDDAELTIENSTLHGNRALGQDKPRETKARALLPSTEDIPDMSGMGGAVFAYDPARLYVNATNFTDNSGCQGGGAMIVVQAAAGAANNGTHSFNISHALFEGNAAYCDAKDASRLNDYYNQMYHGGALMQESSDSMVHDWTIIHSEFRQNRAALGGAISFLSRLRSDVEQSVISCSFIENDGLVAGGAILLDATRLKIVRTEIRNSRSVFGGGLVVRRNAFLTIVQDPKYPAANSSSSIIEGNIGVYGGGMFVDSGGVHLEALTVRNNIGYRIGGGCRFLSTDRPSFLRGVRIEGNQAFAGGGISLGTIDNVTLVGLGEKYSVIANNTATVGGGLYYEAGEFYISFIRIEETLFIANRALSSTSSEIVAFNREAEKYHLKYSKGVNVSNINEETERSSVMEYIKTRESGHGGGISINVFRTRPFIIHEIAFQNVTVVENAAIVGGGISVQTKKVHKNVASNVSCSSASLGFDTCQRIVFRNVTVARNKAEYAGGLFVSSLDYMTFSCGPNATWASDTHEPSKAMVDQRRPFCTEISNNTLINASATEAADIGTRVAKLSVKGEHHQLKPMASGDTLVVVCEDIQNATCNRSLEILVKDTFGQRIEQGLDDANLELTLSSEAILGDHRYKAIRGTAVIDSTQAFGVNVNKTLMIAAEENRDVYVQLDLTTRACYPGEVIQSNHCATCAVDKYEFDPSQEKCRSCEKNARCRGGAALVPIDGYWHSTPFSPVFCKCIDQKACQYGGRTDKLMAFYENASALTSRLSALNKFIEKGGQMPDFSEYQQCLEGYDGPLCGSCQPDYGHSHSYGCEECPQEKTTGVRLTFVAVWLFVVIGLNCVVTLMTTNTRIAFAKYERQAKIITETRVLQRTEHIQAAPVRIPHPLSGESGLLTNDVMRLPLATSSTTAVAAATQRRLYAQQLMLAVTLTEILKILVNYLQVTGTALRLQTEWTGPLRILLQFEAGWVGFLDAFMSTPFECGLEKGIAPASVSALWMRLTMPWLALAAIELTFVLVWLCTQRYRHMREFQLPTCLIVIALVSVNFSFIDVTRELMRAVNCVQIAEMCTDDSAGHPYGNYSLDTAGRLWAEDTSLVCFEGSHLPLGIVGIIGLAVSFCGIVTIILWLPMNREHVGKSQFIARYWFMYQAYRNEWHTVSWESVILARKSAIVAVAVFSVHLNPNLQAAMCAGILTVAVVLQAMFTPFKIPEKHISLPDYAGDIFKRFCLQNVGRWWMQFNDAIHLNLIETASLASSASVYFSAIVLQDSGSSVHGRRTISTLSFAANVAFVLYVLYRLYAGVHLLLDLKLEQGNTAFIAEHENGMGILSLIRKICAFLRVLRRSRMADRLMDDGVEKSNTLELSVLHDRETVETAAA